MAVEKESKKMTLRYKILLGFATVLTAILVLFVILTIVLAFVNGPQENDYAWQSAIEFIQSFFLNDP